jgi:hypothetical protein
MVSSPNHPKIVDVLRDLADVVANAQFSPAIAERVSLTTHELVDNAVRYGSLRDIDYEFAYDPSAGQFRVRVDNAALPSRISLLNAHLDKIKKLPNGGFADLFRSAAAGKHTVPLGLARVRHEGSMELRVELKDDRVNVIATGRL